MIKQKMAKVEAAQRALEEERKDYLMSRSVRQVLAIIDEKLSLKNQLLQDQITKDLQNELKLLTRKQESQF